MSVYSVPSYKFLYDEKNASRVTSLLIVKDLIGSTSMVFLYNVAFFFWTFSMMLWNYTGRQKGQN